MAIQAWNNEQEQGKNLEEFYETVDVNIHFPDLTKFLKTLLRIRPKKLKSNLSRNSR